MGNVILVVNPDEKYYMQKKGNQYMNNCYTPLELKQKIENQDIVVSSDVDNPIREHLWLTKYPTDNAYVQLTEDNECVDIERKINAIENIISYLGGTNFSAESFTGITRKVGVGYHPNRNADAVIEEMPVNINGFLNAQGDINFDGQHNVRSETRWSGICTPESYERAKTIARQTHLDQDSTIQYLLEQRNPAHPNQLTAKTYIVNVRRDVNENAEIALGMKASLSTLFSSDLELKLNYSQVESLQSEFKFSVEFLPQISPVGRIELPDVQNEPKILDEPHSQDVTSSPKFSEIVDRVNAEIEKRAISEEVEAKLKAVSSRFADYTPTSEYAETVNQINAEIEKRAISEDVDAKLESVSSRFSDYTPSLEIAETVDKINAEIEKRAISEDVEAKLKAVSSKFADYTPSSEVAETVNRINAEIEKRAISEEVDAKIEAVSSRFADYATSSSVDELIMKINAELENRAQIDINLQRTLEKYKKISLIVSIGLGIISVSGLSMVIYLLSQFVW